MIQIVHEKEKIEQKLIKKETTTPVMKEQKEAPQKEKKNPLPKETQQKEQKKLNQKEQKREQTEPPVIDVLDQSQFQPNEEIFVNASIKHLTGIVTEIDKNKKCGVKIVPQAISVPRALVASSDFARKSSISTGSLIRIDAATFGVVSSVKDNKFSVVTNNGQKLVPAAPYEVLRSDNQTVDMNGTRLYEKDVIMIQGGKMNGARAIITYVYQNFVFIASVHGANTSVECIQSSSCVKNVNVNISPNYFIQPWMVVRACVYEKNSPNVGMIVALLKDKIAVLLVDKTVLLNPEDIAPIPVNKGCRVIVFENGVSYGTVLSVYRDSYLVKIDDAGGPSKINTNKVIVAYV